MAATKLQTGLLFLHFTSSNKMYDFSMAFNDDPQTPLALKAAQNMSVVAGEEPVLSETWLVQEPCDLGTLADAMQVAPLLKHMPCLRWWW